jgi:iron only hydrogenase large subunit-like protein
MENLSKETTEFLNLVKKNEKMVAMLAPSFPVDFEYPQTIGMLKRLGFEYVAEVTRGAIETNNQLLDLLKNNPNKRYITNPCPNIVRLVKSKFPELVQYLTPIDSPMSATAKIVAEKYPGYKIVFIGPCIAKKMEAKEDWPELNILVLTYKELKQIFGIKNIVPEESDNNASFDIRGTGTELYPISGGLAQSSCLNEKITNQQLCVISGPALVINVLKEFKNNQDLKILDVLSCECGCVNGPGVYSKEPIDVRRQKIIKYWQKG